MKKRLITFLLLLIMSALFTGCKMEDKEKQTEVVDNGITEVKETYNESQVQVEVDNTSTVSLTPTVTPTAAPTVAPEPTNTPIIEKEAYDIKESPFLLSNPPFEYYISEKVTDKAAEALKLEIISSEPNDITDEAEWFADNNLTYNSYQVPNANLDVTGNLPIGIDPTWKDLLITSAFYDDSYVYCTYGSDYSQGYILEIYDAKTLKIVYSLDFSNYRYIPEFPGTEFDYIQEKINWATIQDNILYISHSHNTYANSTNNLNAYITAIDLTDMSILWRSDALISNAYNFLIQDDVIICGYGFTAEPDYLYQLNIHNGEVLDKILLKTSPLYFAEKDNVLYVRTYNMNYVFNIKQ